MQSGIGALGALLTAGLLLPNPATHGALGLQASGLQASALSGTSIKGGSTQSPLRALYAQSASRFGIPEQLLRAVCYVESKHNPKAYSPMDGHTPSHGVCQVKLATAISLGFRGSARELQRPEVSIHYAAAYLAYQLKRYRGDQIKAIKAYNIGHARTRARNAYVNRVLKAMREGR